MDFKYFQICREWKVNDGGVVPKLGQEINKCLIAAVEASNRESFERIGKALNYDLVFLYDNKIFNENRITDLKKENPLIVSPQAASIHPPSPGPERALFTQFSQGFWLFDVSILRGVPAILIIARFRFEWESKPQDKNLNRIIEIENSFSQQKLNSYKLDDSFFWEFKKDSGGPENFF